MNALIHIILAGWITLMILLLILVIVHHRAMSQTITPEQEEIYQAERDYQSDIDHFASWYGENYQSYPDWPAYEQAARARRDKRIANASHDPI